MLDRRRFLRTIGVLGVTGSAGCTETLEEKTITPPEVESPSEVEPLREDTPTQTETVTTDEKRLTADGHPKITLNWAFHYSDAMPRDAGLKSVGNGSIPQRPLDLSIVSAVGSFFRGTYLEEYQTADAAKERLDLEVGNQFTGANSRKSTEAEVISIEDIDGYPNDWYLFESESEIHALSRAGGVIAGGSVDESEYRNTTGTVLEQLQTRNPPEGEGISQWIFELLDVFGDQYGHTSLDLEGHTAASVPMEEFSSSRAKEMLIEYYEYATEESIYSVGSHELDEFPIDAYDSYEMSVNEEEVDRDIGAGMHCEVTSWHSQEYATEYARSIISKTDWAFSANHELPRQACRFFSDDGTQRFDRVGIDLHSDPLPVTDTYSGNVTIVLRPFVN